MEEAIVLYSTPDHLNSVYLLAAFIAKHYPSISLVVISTAAAPSPLSSAPSVTFHRLPLPALPPNATFNPVELFFEIPRFNNPNLRRALAEISTKSKIRAILLDFFCNYAFEVAASLGIPTFYFNSIGASGLCALIYWTTIHEESGGKIAGAAEIPGCPLIPAADLPEMYHFPESLGYRHFLETAVNIQRSGGVIVNSFYALEVRAIEALRNGLCTPGAPPTPVYALGPLINPPAGKQNDAVSEHDCLRWLDSQPSKSVIFLCFGRRGAFSAEQLKETAVGLENSGYRFLWAVRAPPGKAAAAAEEPDLEALLPEGFLERTRERAFVLKSWAPQTEVLSHDSVGGFVTHCGQSSMLEAVSFGVPMIGWPLYAEQKMNRLFMVEEMKVGLHLEAAEKGFVTAAELEKRIRELMESVKGREVRRRVTEMKFATAAAVRKGGSSVVALEKFMAATLTPV